MGCVRHSGCVSCRGGPLSAFVSAEPGGFEAFPRCGLASHIEAANVAMSNAVLSDDARNTPEAGSDGLASGTTRMPEGAADAGSHPAEAGGAGVDVGASSKSPSSDGEGEEHLVPPAGLTGGAGAGAGAGAGQPAGASDRRLGAGWRHRVPLPPMVEHVLVAEFDIDRGSVLQHMHPPTVGWTASGSADTGAKSDEGLEVLPNWTAGHIAEAMLPEGVHNLSDDWTAFIVSGGIMPGGGVALTTGAVSAPPSDDSGEDEDDDPLVLFGYARVRTQLDATVKRGAVVRAVGVVTRYTFFPLLRATLDLALDEYFAAPTAETVRSIYRRLAAVDMSALTPWPDYDERRAMRATIPLNYRSVGSVFFKPSGMYPRRTLTVEWSESTSLEIKVPVASEPDQIAGASTVDLIKVFSDKVMTIFNAVLTGQRVLFVGHKSLPAGVVCNMVLAACALVCPPCQGTLRRAFPYCSLTDLSFLRVPGYIAGVTNPVFKERTQWWDVMCDIHERTVTVADPTPVPRAPAPPTAPDGASEAAPLVGAVTPRLAASTPSLGAGASAGSAPRRPPKPPPRRRTDSRGMAHIDRRLTPEWLDSRVAHQLLSGLRFGEHWVRTAFEAYTTRLVRYARILNNQGLTPSTTALLTANAVRLKQLRVTAQYRFALAQLLRHRSPAAIDALQSVKMLMGTGQLPLSDVERAFAGIVRWLHLEKASVQLVALVRVCALRPCHNLNVVSSKLDVAQLPEWRGGLHVVLAGVLSASIMVQKCAAYIIRQLEGNEVSRPATSSMNYFLASAYHRLVGTFSEDSVERWAQAIVLSSPRSTAAMVSGKSATAPAVWLADVESASVVSSASSSSELDDCGSVLSASDLGSG